MQNIYLCRYWPSIGLVADDYRQHDGSRFDAQRFDTDAHQLRPGRRFLQGRRHA
jgi:hypothetical protein